MLQAPGPRMSRREVTGKYAGEKQEQRGTEMQMAVIILLLTAASYPTQHSWLSSSSSSSSSSLFP
jgi:hypothetical protein